MAIAGKSIVYPPGVKDLSEEISTDDLVRRLKECALAFQSMAQEEENAVIYEPLALLLISERFLEHNSLDVRLYVACCIADIFRVFAPDAPYRDEYQIKMILEFFIEQLEGLIDPQSPNYKRYFYLLENLSVVKTFNVCFDLTDCQPIVCSLFKLMFKIIQEYQYLKLQRIIVDLLCPLINEADVISMKLLNIIFNRIIEPFKSNQKNATMLAQEILRKTATCIDPYVQEYFKQEFLSHDAKKSKNVCEVIYELRIINPNMVAFVIPELEGKLKSTEEEDRMKVIKLVAKMFSDENSNMIAENRSLWISFLGRAHDASANVRALWVKYTRNFLLYHPESKREIGELLVQRSHDTDEIVRFEFINTICSAAKENIRSVDSTDIKYLTERTLDKMFRIRKESLFGLAKLYKQYILDSDYVDPVAEHLLSFVKNKVFHVYYQECLEDKFLVERILHTCLVPYVSPMERRMKLLYQLYCTFDHNAARAFKEILKNQKHMRSLTNGLLEIIQQENPNKRLKMAKISAIAKSLRDPQKSAENILKFCKHLETDLNLRAKMSSLLSGNISCNEAANKVKAILKGLGEPESKNAYYNCIKQLLERIVPVLLDKASVKYLVMIAKDSVIGDHAIETELKLVNSATKGLDLINALANTYPHYFADEEVFRHFIQILQADDADIAKITLETLSFISKNLENIYPSVYRELLPILESFIETGTSKQAKYATYTVYRMVNDKEAVFGPIIENLQKHFHLDSQYYRTAMVSIGHIAYLCHDMFATQFKAIVAQTVVKELLMIDNDIPRGGEDLWGPFDTLPEETKIKIEGMKVMVRWLTGLKDMVKPAGSNFKLLNLVIQHKGDLMESNYLGPKEMSWMRLSSANCFLKLCREPKYADCLEVDFFVQLAYVMNDECPEVRELFAAKVHKGLYYMKLPLEFLAILALGGLDTRKEFRSQIKRYLNQNIIKRREYCKENSVAVEELPYQWPDYSLPIAIYLFARAPFFTEYNDVPSLLKIKDCLQLFLDALIAKREHYSFSFFKRLLENIKQTKDRLEPNEESRNLKLYAVCDLALNILMSEKTIRLTNFPGQPKLNSKFFTEPDKSYSNLVTYLPPELLNTNRLVESGFEIQVFDKIREKNPAKDISKASTSKEKPLPTTSNGENIPASNDITKPSTSNEKPLPCTSNKENIPSSSQVKPVPSTSRVGIPANSGTGLGNIASTNSNSPVSQSIRKSSCAKLSNDTSPNSIGSCGNKDTSNHSGPNSQTTPRTNGIASDVENKSESNNLSDSEAMLKNGDINHLDTNSNQSDMEVDEAASSLKNNKRNVENTKISTLKKKPVNNHREKRAVNNHKHTGSSQIVKDSAPVSLCSEYTKQNGVLSSSPSAMSVDSLSPSDYENMIKPCSVYLKKLKDSAAEVFNGNQNGGVSLKKMHNDMDSEDYSSNQGSSAGSHLSEESPRKRGRPPKKNGKLNEEPSLLPSSKRRKIVSTAVNSSPKSSPTKTVVKNGRIPRGKKIMKEELNSKMHKIKNGQVAYDKTTTNKRANGQQNKKNDVQTTSRRRR